MWQAVEGATAQIGIRADAGRKRCSSSGTFDPEQKLGISWNSRVGFTPQPGWLPSKGRVEVLTDMRRVCAYHRCGAKGP